MNFKCVAVIVFGGCATLAAGAAGSLDPSFDPNVTGTEAFAVAIQPDGKILIGGEFTQVGGKTLGNFARLNPDGTVESSASFNPGTGANARVNSISVQRDGRIILCGDFTLVDGLARNRIARLLTNGGVESSEDFDTGTGANGRIRSAAAQSDGKIVITGDFTTFGGASRNRLARLNSEGRLEDLSTFNPGSGANSTIHGAWIQPDGKILIWGRFTSFNGQPRNYIARLNANGTLESSSTFSAAGANNWVWSLAVQPDGAILIGGEFTSYGGTARPRIARLNPDGTLQGLTAFNPGAGADGAVRSLVLQADGKILMSGLFNTVDGQSRSGIARLLPNGALEGSAGFNIGTGIGPGSNIEGIAVEPEGNIVAVGFFTTFDGHPRNRCARLLNDPVIQSLSAPDQTRLQWMRGGACAEVDQVMFELSNDGGTTWSLLGPGTRVPGGWQVTGLSLPDAGRVRSRGHTAFGYHNGSSGFVESVAPLAFTALASWRLTHFGASENDGSAANMADPDHDGLANLTEYAFGLDPNSPDAVALPHWTRSGDDYVLSFASPKDVSGISYAAEYSSSLADESWTALPNASIPPAYQWYAPADLTGRLFLRIRVTAPE